MPSRTTSYSMPSRILFKFRDGFGLSLILSSEVLGPGRASYDSCLPLARLRQSLQVSWLFCRSIVSWPPLLGSSSTSDFINFSDFSSDFSFPYALALTRRLAFAEASSLLLQLEEGSSVLCLPLVPNLCRTDFTPSLSLLLPLRQDRGPWLFYSKHSLPQTLSPVDLQGTSSLNSNLSSGYLPSLLSQLDFG